AFQLPDQDVAAIAEYLHSVLARAGRQGRPPEGEAPIELNVLVGDPSAGAAYFSKACARCHTPTGDLKGLASRVADARELQNLWVAGRPGGRGGPGGTADDAVNPAIARTVTITTPGGETISGRLVRIDDFIVTLIQDNGERRTFRREGGAPKVEVHDRLEPHRPFLLEVSHRDMHHVPAYLAMSK